MEVIKIKRYIYITIFMVFILVLLGMFYTKKKLNIYKFAVLLEFNTNDLNENLSDSVKFTKFKLNDEIGLQEVHAWRIDMYNISQPDTPAYASKPNIFLYLFEDDLYHYVDTLETLHSIKTDKCLILRISLDMGLLLNDNTPFEPRDYAKLKSIFKMYGKEF